MISSFEYDNNYNNDDADDHDDNDDEIIFFEVKINLAVTTKKAFKP